MKPTNRPRGRPRKKRKGKVKDLAEQAQAPRPRPSCSQPSDNADTDDDTGAPDVWDPHAGLKPSALDDCASDADVEMEGSVPYGAESEVSGVMVDMMAGLDDCDAQDMDWLPPREQRMLDARKRGTQSVQLQDEISRSLTGAQEKEKPIIMGQISLRNRNEHSDAPNTLGQ